MELRRAVVPWSAQGVAPMPTFYFHLRKDGELVADKEGQEFQNLDEVR